MIDDFLSGLEHDDLLTHALGARTQFQGGSAYEAGGDERLSSVDLAGTFHGRLLESRLLVWFPMIARALGLRMFALAPFEARLTAATDGYRSKLQWGEMPELPRVLTCLYFLHREPRGFAGGELLFYDRVEDGGVRGAGERAAAVAPVANRLVVFPGEECHEVLPVRCPSGEFADSRFAVTTWLRSATRLDPHRRFGWGRFRCGVVAPQFAFAEVAGMA